MLARGWEVLVWTPRFDGRKLDDITEVRCSSVPLATQNVNTFCLQAYRRQATVTLRNSI
jgi:hypothetical protein